MPRTKKDTKQELTLEDKENNKLESEYFGREVSHQYTSWQKWGICQWIFLKVHLLLW